MQMINALIKIDDILDLCFKKKNQRLFSVQIGYQHDWQPWPQAAIQCFCSHGQQARISR
jgi:hypothetical protein